MPLTFNPQRLRETQLSASKSHAQARQDARNPSSVLQSRKPRSSRNAAGSLIGDPDTKAGLEEAATKIFALCVPWPELWTIHGSWIVATPNEKQRGQQSQQVTCTDDLGAEILASVPHHLVDLFLSAAGQTIVSSPNGLRHEYNEHLIGERNDANYQGFAHPPYPPGGTHNLRSYCSPDMVCQ